MVDRAEERALKAYPIAMSEFSDSCKEYDVNESDRLTFIEGYHQAEKDFFVKAEKWLCEIHRVCDITDEHGYRIDVRELIGRFEEYIKQ